MHGRTYLRTSRESLTVFLKKQQDIDRLDFFNGSQLSIFEESRSNHPFGDICLSRKKNIKRYRGKSRNQESEITEIWLDIFQLYS